MGCESSSSSSDGEEGRREERRSGLGVLGAERARRWWGLRGDGWWDGWWIAGEEEDDLRDDLRGLPLERKMGELEVLATFGRGDGGAGSVSGVSGERGEERGNGMAPFGR